MFLTKARHVRLGGRLIFGGVSRPSICPFYGSKNRFLSSLLEDVEGTDDTTTSIDAKEFRNLHDMRIKGFGGDLNDIAPFTTFDALPFSPGLVRSMRNQGFSAPTAIQAQSWPIALMKRDLISIARTGSGKTCAFLLPALQAISQTQQSPQRDKKGSFSRSRARHLLRKPRALVLAPTRELAQQIEREASKLCPAVGITSACFYGGSSKGPQIRQLSRGVDVVVATPGRCNDLIDIGALDLSEVDYLVLDEADRMLDMGFEPQIRKILLSCKRERQSLFFTATWPKEVQGLALEYLNDPVTINIGDLDKLQANKAITQHIHIVSPVEKYQKLEELLEELTVEASKKTRAMQTIGESVQIVKDIDGMTEVAPPIEFNPMNVPKTLIFVAKKADCDDIAYDIRDAGYAVGTLHGDKSQEARAYIMQEFRRNNIKVLVATDVAARGLDITDIECVINFDFPVGKSAGVENYVHRIGRTARGNRTGVAHSFFTQEDAPLANHLVGILERADQRVPDELRRLCNSKKTGGSSKINERFGSDFDLIGGRSSSRRGASMKQSNERFRKNSTTNSRESRFDGYSELDNDFSDDDYFYRKGGFKVGKTKYDSSGKNKSRNDQNRKKRPRYKSIFDDDDFF